MLAAGHSEAQLREAAAIIVAEARALTASPLDHAAIMRRLSQVK